MNVLQYRWYYSNGDDAYYIIGDSAITLTVTSVLQYRLVITLSVITVLHYRLLLHYWCSLHYRL